MIPILAPGSLVGVLIATIPNIVIGVAILILRSKILAVVKAMAPTMSEDGSFRASRVILITGLFLTGMASFLLITFLTTPR